MAEPILWTGTPTLATVIAASLDNGANDIPPGAADRQTFAAEISLILGGDAHVLPAPEASPLLALSIVVPADAQILALLRRLDHLDCDLKQALPSHPLRILLHHGLVFPGRRGFIGAALRFAHTRQQRLRESTPDARRAATADFVTATQTWNNGRITFAGLDDTINPTLFRYRLSEPAIQACQQENALAWRAFLTERLANYLGPFATILIDAAWRSAAQPQQIIQELAREIDEPAARARFLAETRAYMRQNGMSVGIGNPDHRSSHH